MSIKKTIAALLILTAASLGAASSARADLYDVTGFWAGDQSVSFSYVGKDFNGKVVGTTSKPYTESGGAGGFKVYDLTTDQKQQPFQAWCIDIFNTFSFPESSNDTLKKAGAPGSLLNPTQTTDLDLLYTEHYQSVTGSNISAMNEAAFQLAVWEIVNESSGNSLNLTNGAFQATGYNTGKNYTNTTYYKTVTEADQWLSALHANNAIAKYNAEILQVNGYEADGPGPQDLLIFEPIPEPQTYAMLIAGLAVVTYTIRQRRKQAARR